MNNIKIVAMPNKANVSEEEKKKVKRYMSIETEKNMKKSLWCGYKHRYYPKKIYKDEFSIFFDREYLVCKKCGHVVESIGIKGFYGCYECNSMTNDVRWEKECRT